MPRSHKKKREDEIKRAAEQRQERNKFIKQCEQEIDALIGSNLRCSESIMKATMLWCIQNPERVDEAVDVLIKMLEQYREECNYVCYD